MNRDEVREYLARWLLEFGTEPAADAHRGQNEWYNNSEVPNYNDDALIMYFDTAPDKWNCASREVWLNQAGLDLIKGDPIEKT